MSGSGMRELMAIIEQNLEVLREMAIHGSGEMKALAIALLIQGGGKRRRDLLAILAGKPGAQ